MKLSGGVILRDLTDDQCRQASADYARYLNRDIPIPVDVALGRNEHRRRTRAGQIESLTDRSKWAAASPVGHVP